MPTPGVHSKAGEAVAENGLVMLDGPDGIAITLTHHAAYATGQSLIKAASEARSQSDGPKEASI